MAGSELSVHRGVNIFHSTRQLADTDVHSTEVTFRRKDWADKSFQRSFVCYQVFRNVETPLTLELKIRLS